MSQENVEAVRLVYSAWSDGDLDALLAVCDPGVELLTSGAFPDLVPVYRGHDGIRAFWQSMRVPWESFHLDPERMVEGEDCAVVAVRFRAQGKDSGVATELRTGPCAAAQRWLGCQGFDPHVVQRGPRSRGPLGVGDVARERGGSDGGPGGLQSPRRRGLRRSACPRRRDRAGAGGCGRNRVSRQKRRHEVPRGRGRVLGEPEMGGGRGPRRRRLGSCPGTHSRSRT